MRMGLQFIARRYVWFAQVIAAGRVSGYASFVRRTGLRFSGHAAFGPAGYAYGIAMEARRCVWPARSTPLNWESFDFRFGKLGVAAQDSPYLCVRQRP